MFLIIKNPFFRIFLISGLVLLGFFFFESKSFEKPVFTTQNTRINIKDVKTYTGKITNHECGDGICFWFEDIPYDSSCCALDCEVNCGNGCWDGICQVTYGENTKWHENCCEEDCVNMNDCSPNICDGISIENFYLGQVSNSPFEFGLYLNVCNYSEIGQEFPLEWGNAKFTYSLFQQGYGVIWGSNVSDDLSIYWSVDVDSTYLPIEANSCKIIPMEVNLESEWFAFSDLPFFVINVSLKIPWPLGVYQTCWFIEKYMNLIQENESFSCGDKSINWNSNYFEQCDDGNQINGDGCSSDCRSEFCLNGSPCITESDCLNQSCKSVGYCLWIYQDSLSGTLNECGFIQNEEECTISTPESWECQWVDVYNLCECQN